MADFSQDILKEILKATKESNKKLGTLERQGEEDDTPRSIIAQSLPEVAASRRYSYTLPKELGLFKVDDILNNILKAQHGGFEAMARQFTATKEVTAEIKKQQLLITYHGGVADAAMEEDTTLLKQMRDVLGQGLEAWFREFRFNEEDRKDARTKITEQEDERKKLTETLEKQGKVLTDQKKYNKLTYKIQKAELDLRLKNAVGSAERKEIKEEQKALDRKNQNFLRKIADGMTGLWNAAKENVSKVRKGFWALLKGAAVAGLLVAFLAFLESDIWEKWKKIIIEDIGPMLKKVYDKILVPIGNFLKNTFGPFFEDLEKWLDSPTWGELADVIADNKLATLMLSIALMLFTPLGAITAGLIRVMAGIAAAFGPAIIRAAFAVGGPIAVILAPAALILTIGSALIDGFKAYFTDAEEWGVTPLSAAVGAFFGGRSVDGGIRNAFSQSMKFAIAGVSLGLMMGNPFLALALGGIGAAIGGIAGWFGGKKLAEWRDKSHEFIGDLWELLTTELDLSIWHLLFPLILTVRAIRNVTGGMGNASQWLLETFGILSKPGEVGGPDDVYVQATTDPKTRIITPGHYIRRPGGEAGDDAEPSKPAPVLTEREMFRGFLVRQYKEWQARKWEDPTHQADELKRILKELKALGFSSIDAAIAGMPAGKATGGSFFANHPMIVGELGPELIFPNRGGHVMNAQRTAQILASGINRGMSTGGGGPSIVNAPVTSVNNSQSNMTLTSTSLKHPSAILATINAAA